MTNSNNVSFQVNLLDLIRCLSDTLDLLSPILADHHERTAYIAYNISREMGLPDNELMDVFMAASLHDIGASSIDDRLITFDFETTSKNHHAVAGARIIQEFPPLAFLSQLIQYHHTDWNFGNAPDPAGRAAPIGSYIINLADRIDVLINRKRHILTQTGEICDVIKKCGGNIFPPDIVSAFMGISRKESFWMDLVSPTLWRVIQKSGILHTIQKEEFDQDKLIAFAQFFSKLIDYRSRYTATHSSGVAALGEFLARHIGFSEHELIMIKIAGYLHDLGKLAIPHEILEKPGALSVEEYGIMKSHVYHTYMVLQNIESFDVISQWASFHHEFLDGTGYPFHHDRTDIPLGSRIIAVADKFTAVSEDRPYRKGMDFERAFKLLQELSDNGKIDGNILATLRENAGKIEIIRKNTQAAERQNYDKLNTDLGIN